MLSLLPCLVLAAPMAVPAKPVSVAEKHLVVLLDPKASFEDRCAAEDMLLKLPALDVLPRILPFYGRGMPEGGIWNSTGERRSDRTGPVRWLIFYALSRIWTDQIDRLPEKGGGEALLRLLQEATTDRERGLVLAALNRRWSPNAEKVLANLLHDEKESGALRRDAAGPLIERGTGDYRDILLKAARAAPHAEKVAWFDLLARPRLRSRKGMDPRVVQLGFHLVQAEKANTSNIHGAYFIVCTLERYVGEKFTANLHDPKYKGDGRLTDAFFGDTVTTALTWWERSRGALEKKALEKGK